MTLPLSAPEVAHVPRNFAFPVNPCGPVRVPVSTMTGDRYDLLIGGVAPLGGAANAEYTCLTMAHQRVMLRAMYARAFDSPDVKLAPGDLLKQGPSHGSSAYRQLQRIINDLAGAWIHVIREGQPVRSVRLMTFEGQITYRSGVVRTKQSDISKEENVAVRRLHKVVFAEEFWRGCLNWQECWSVRVDALDAMTSDLAAFCYLKLAPNTHNPSKPAGARFKRDARKLLEEAGVSVNENWRVKEYFERVRGETGSVLRQMDNQQMWKDLFRVAPELERNADGTGYNVIYWRQERDEEQEAKSFKNLGALHELWTKHTGSAAGFYEAARHDWATLEPHNIQGLEALGYGWQPHERFLVRVRSFIGPVRFDTVLGSAKMGTVDAANGGEPIRDIGAYVGGALTREFEAWLAEFTKPKATKNAPIVSPYRVELTCRASR